MGDVVRRWVDGLSSLLQRSAGAARGAAGRRVALSVLSAAAGAAPPARRVVRAPVLSDEEDDLAPPPRGIRVRARIEQGGESCSFLVDRPVVEGVALRFSTPASAASAPLPAKLFRVDGVASVVLRGRVVTVRRGPDAARDWPDLAVEIGRVLRAHLEAGAPAVSPDALRDLPASAEIERRLDAVIETRINPSLSTHAGRITLDRVEGNTAYIRMSGGCQGCSAAELTLREGIEKAFREAVPELGAVLDITDHAAGERPYFTREPGGFDA